MEQFTMKENLKFYTERVKWYFKQLLPLTYVNEYTAEGQCDTCHDRRIVIVWRMWFGRCFNVREWEIAPHTSGEVA